MANSLKDLLAQRAELEVQISQAQQTEKADAIHQVKSLMAEYGLTMADIQVAAAKSKRGGVKTGKVAAKYRDASTGDSWSGRGLQPKWLRAALSSGRKLAEFAL